MIRNTPEYMHEDGSPRYGVRTEDHPAAAPAAVAAAGVPVASVPRLLQLAAEMDGAELNLAAQHRFVLDRFKADSALIKVLRKAHPGEVKEAEAAVAGRLGSPDAWMRGARKAYRKEVSADMDRDGTVLRKGMAALALLFLLLAMLSIITWLALSGAPTLPAVLILLVVLIGTKPLRLKLARIAFHGAVSSRLTREEGESFWDDIVNATLLAVLAEKGVAVDGTTSAAAGRGWAHTRFVAGISQDLRSKSSL